MEAQNVKCVMVIDAALPVGLVSNTAAILGATLGRRVPELIREDVTDADGRTHLGIVAVPVPVLKGDAGMLQTLRERLYEPEYADVLTVDFSALAQGCGQYDEFAEKIAAEKGNGLRYLGVALYGDKKKVNRLTGSLPLLR